MLDLLALSSSRREIASSSTYLYRIPDNTAQAFLHIAARNKRARAVVEQTVKKLPNYSMATWSEPNARPCQPYENNFNASSHARGAMSPQFKVSSSLN